MKRLALLLGLALPWAAHAASPVFDETPGGQTTLSDTVINFTATASTPDNSFGVGMIRQSGTSDFYNDDCELSSAGTPIWDNVAEIASTSNRLYVLANANVDGGGGVNGIANCTNSSIATTRTYSAWYTGAATSSELDGAILTGTFTTGDGTTISATSKTLTFTDLKVICGIIVDTATTIAAANGETLRGATYDSRMEIQDIDKAAGGSHQCKWTIVTTSNGAWFVLALKSTTSVAAGGGNKVSSMNGPMALKGPT